MLSYNGSMKLSGKNLQLRPSMFEDPHPFGHCMGRQQGPADCFGGWVEYRL